MKRTLTSLSIWPSLPSTWQLRQPCVGSNPQTASFFYIIFIQHNFELYQDCMLLACVERFISLLTCYSAFTTSGLSSFLCAKYKLYGETCLISRDLSWELNSDPCSKAANVNSAVVAHAAFKNHKILCLMHISQEINLTGLGIRCTCIYSKENENLLTVKFQAEWSAIKILFFLGYTVACQLSRQDQDQDMGRKTKSVGCQPRARREWAETIAFWSWVFLQWVHGFCLTSLSMMTRHLSYLLTMLL